VVGRLLPERNELIGPYGICINRLDWNEVPAVRSSIRIVDSSAFLWMGRHWATRKDLARNPKLPCEARGGL
jgi:hypothetical protein